MVTNFRNLSCKQKPVTWYFTKTDIAISALTLQSKVVTMYTDLFNITAFWHSVQRGYLRVLNIFSQRRRIFPQKRHCLIGLCNGDQLRFLWSQNLSQTWGFEGLICWLNSKWNTYLIVEVVILFRHLCCDSRCTKTSIMNVSFKVSELTLD